MSYLTQEYFLTEFSFHRYVHFSLGHMPRFIRVSKELSQIQFSFEVTSLISHIGNLLFIIII